MFWVMSSPPQPWVLSDWTQSTNPILLASSQIGNDSIRVNDTWWDVYWWFRKIDVLCLPRVGMVWRYRFRTPVSTCYHQSRARSTNEVCLESKDEVSTMDTVWLRCGEVSCCPPRNWWSKPFLDSELPLDFQ